MIMSLLMRPKTFPMGIFEDRKKKLRLDRNKMVYKQSTALDS